jgi:uncharacterized membrane protein YfhO
VNAAHHISIDTFTSQNAKNEHLKQYTVSDVKNSANKYTFNTNFDKEKIVVTRLAYEDGFTLLAFDTNGNKKDINVFNAQGGFISFICPKGSYSFELSFMTPNLKTASLISSFGVFSYFATMVSFVFLDLRKKEKELTNLL